MLTHFLFCVPQVYSLLITNLYNKISIPNTKIWFPGIILSVIGVTIRGQEHQSVDYCEPCGRAFVDNTDIRSSFENIAEKLFHLVVETRNEICKLYRVSIWNITLPEMALCELRWLV